MITTNDTDQKIELLPEHIIDQIKAGEVLERPASLIKELIENSIDALSDEISIHIIENGLDLISIEDNGKGMSFQNLPYAFLRHATSKIKTYDDLYKLRSYGFRGEALASIAASSRVTCQTQPRNLNLEGGKIVINGGLEELLVPMKNPRSGTSFYIKNLFYNTPARLKFIKSKTSEKIQLKRMIYSFLLSHPEIQFTIKWDEKEKEVFKKLKREDYKERFSQLIFGKNKEQSPILFSESHYEGHTVKVFFTLEAQKNSPNKHQFLFANQRMFFDKNLHQTIIRNTDSIWKYGESGHYAIFIECPPDEIDVNVHPNKTQLKFSKNDIVYSLLVTSIKDAIKKYQSAHIITEDNNHHNGNEPAILSFIDTEEERSFSLNELRDRTFDSRPMPSSVSQISSDTKESSTNNLVILSDKFFIFNFQNKHFLANKVVLFATYLTGLIQECKVKEEMVSPLLISEPIYCKNNIDIHFDTLKAIGFEFDRINPDIIVLRTIPRKIHRDFIKLSATIITDYFSQTKISEFEYSSFQKFVLKNAEKVISVDSSILFKLHESQSEVLISNSVLLTDLNLDRLFHE